MKNYHLTAVLHLLRHGEKTKDGSLTDLGHQQAVLRALESMYVDGDIYVTHSGSDRVWKTTMMFQKYIAESARNTHERNMAEEILQHTNALRAASIEVAEGVRPELQFLHNPKEKGTYFASWNAILATASATERAQGFVDYQDRSPDPDIAYSPKEMAMRVSALLYEQICAAEATPHTTRTNYINGTHEPVVTAFLYYALNSFSAGSSSFIEEMGGPIDYTEGPTISVYQDETQAIFLQLSFRNRLVLFTKDELGAFAGV